MHASIATRPTAAGFGVSTAGVVPAQNLREAVWMLLLRGEVEEVQLNAEFYPLPDGVTPQATVRRDDRWLRAVLKLWSHTGQTY